MGERLKRSRSAEFDKRLGATPGFCFIIHQLRRASARHPAFEAHRQLWPLHYPNAPAHQATTAMSAVTDISDSDKKRPWLKTGRKTTYSDKKAEAFCRYISLGHSLKKACSQPNMPSITQVYEWKRRYPEFAQLFEQAQIERGLSFGDRIGDLAEQVLAGEVDPAAARVAMDGYKFTAARLASKTWGEKSQVTVEHSVSAQAAQVLQELAQRGKARQIEAQCIDVTPVPSLGEGVSTQQDQLLTIDCTDPAPIGAVDEAGPRPPGGATTPAPGCSSSTPAPRKRPKK